MYYGSWYWPDQICYCSLPLHEKDQNTLIGTHPSSPLFLSFFLPFLFHFLHFLFPPLFLPCLTKLSLVLDIFFSVCQQKESWSHCAICKSRFHCVANLPHNGIVIWLYCNFCCTMGAEKNVQQKYDSVAQYTTKSYLLYIFLYPKLHNEILILLYNIFVTPNA